MAQLKSTKVFGDLNVTGEVNASTKITVNGEEVWYTGNLLNIGTTAATARTALGLGAGATRWPTFAEVTGKPSTYAPSGHTHPISQVTGLDAALADKADKTTQVIAGTGLTGGGTLAANRTLAVNYGTAAGTAAQGNDSRITGALQASQVVQATGTSTTSVMSQKVTTDQLATKAASSHTHPWAQVTGQPATATRWPTFAEVTGKPANYATTWDSVAAKPAQATRWPTLAEVTGKPTNYPTNWATVSDKPIVQTVGTSTTNLMSQKAVTDALGAFGQPTMTGSCTTNGTTDNTLVLTGIVSALALEVGDVVQITGSTDGLNDKLFTVELITNNNSIIVNYEHASNRGNGSLRLANQTSTVTITRIAKWYSAASGLGQRYTNVKQVRVSNVIYTNDTGREIFVFFIFKDTLGGGIQLYIDGSQTFTTGDLVEGFYSIYLPIPNGSTYRINSTGGIGTWWEKR